MIKQYFYTVFCIYLCGRLYPCPLILPVDLSLLIARSCQPEGLPLSVTCRAGLLVTRSLWVFFVFFFCFMFNMGTPSFLLRV